MSEESAYCRICGRPLYDPESVKKGIGPICESRLKKGSAGESDTDEPRPR